MTQCATFTSVLPQAQCHKFRALIILHAAQVDPDRFKCRLPETEEYIRRDPTTAGSMTHAESAYLAEIAQEAALQQCKNVLVDVCLFTCSDEGFLITDEVSCNFQGSLRDWRWYTDVFAAIQRDRPHYRIAIIKVTCRRETMHQRAATRGEKTGRVVSKVIFLETVREFRA